jgi:hypothetical protein
MELYTFMLGCSVKAQEQLYLYLYLIGVLGFDSRRRLAVFLFTIASRRALGPTQPHIQWVPGALSLGVRQPGREADHSPPSSAEVKMRGAIPPLPQYAFTAWC